MTRLDEIRKRAEAATSGPWTADLDMFDMNEGIVACVTDEGVNLLATIATGKLIQVAEPWTEELTRLRDEQWRSARDGQELRDAAFIAHAREDVPYLLGEVERLQALLQRAGICEHCAAAFIDPLASRNRP